MLVYDEAKNNGLFMDCINGRMPEKLCLFKKEDLGPCGQGDYGYEERKPCFYLKLNKVTIVNLLVFINVIRVYFSFHDGCQTITIQTICPRTCLKICKIPSRRKMCTT